MYHENGPQDVQESGIGAANIIFPEAMSPSDDYFYDDGIDYNNLSVLSGDIIE
jgi:hypothetical protein